MTKSKNEFISKISLLLASDCPWKWIYTAIHAVICNREIKADMTGTFYLCIFWLIALDEHDISLHKKKKKKKKWPDHYTRTMKVIFIVAVLWGNTCAWQTVCVPLCACFVVHKNNLCNAASPIDPYLNPLWARIVSPMAHLPSHFTLILNLCQKSSP